MRRLAYVCADGGVPVFGTKGCSVHVQEFIRACLHDGIHVTLFATRLGADAPADLGVIPVHRLVESRSGASRAAVDPVLARERSAIARNRGLAAHLAACGPFDAVYERHALWSCGAMEFARAVGIPGLLEVNAPLLREQLQHRSLRLHDVAARMMRRAFHAADVVLPVSDVLGDWLVGEGVARERVHVQPNAVDPTRFAGRPAPALPEAPGLVTIGFLGTLKPWHGLDVLVDAFAVARRRGALCRLLIVGDGPGRPALEARLAGLGLAHLVTWAGAVSPADVPAWLASMDIGVVPYASRDECYFSPLKAFEYMAAGRAVVGSSVGQLPLLLRDGAGIVVPPGDAEALAVALETLCSAPVARARMGELARARVLAEHTWAGTVARVRELARASAARRAPRATTVPTASFSTADHRLPRVDAAEVRDVAANSH
ncbi:glycosyltransferase family 4 protein [Luteitalea sp. TBR-22]|uniref:glycosyltransferase family 4 protein n=1 Tax=Luteitalea sp. TBR-22 TaxID=2802971 RepID=UPI001EF747A7|nr:glycosyltransferase family 4 protein [Luteitalea sp. TBR-22]